MRLFAATLAMLGLAAGALAVQGGAKPASGGWRTYAGVSEGVAIRLPSDWRVAPERLVPKMLAPREVLSAGTFEMTPGGGGNCGMYPVASIRRMGRTDLLITIMRRTGKSGSWFAQLPRWSRAVELPDARRWSLRSQETRSLWTAELVLRRGDDMYSVFAAFGDRPTRAAARRVERILGTVEVRGS